MNSPTKRGQNEATDLTSKDKKFQNLQSNILNNQEDRGIPLYNPDVSKAAMGSDAGWTAQAGSAKIINKGVKVDTYKKLQQQQTSQVFDLPEYAEH